MDRNEWTSAVNESDGRSVVQLDELLSCGVLECGQGKQPKLSRVLIHKHEHTRYSFRFDQS
jgi:hypothetical protein